MADIRHRPDDSPRLSLSSLARLRSGVRAPSYDPAQCRIGIVHLGVGGFHRAHQAAHIDAALAAGESGWAISGWSLRSHSISEALSPQDGLYTLLVREASATQAQVLAPIREIGCASASPNRLIQRLASPDTRIVSLTITEKGYCVAPDGGPDQEAPGIASDLADANPPLTALGWMAAGLRARKALAPRAALTVISCDNLSANGRTLARVLDRFIRLRGEAPLADWVARQVSFPDSMVDRIVPATTATERNLAADLTGCLDAWPVATEPFTQWVIEDRFAAGRPRLEASGVQFSDDVAGWEQMKLRLLNAAHSTIAYLGVSAGWATVDAAIAHAPLEALVRRLWRDEATPALAASLRPQAPVYCDRLLARFKNPALAHRTLQIAADGTKKIPLRWLPTITALAAEGRRWPCLALALAAWIRCLSGTDDQGRPVMLDDPLATSLAPHAALADPARAVRAVLGAVPALHPLAARDDACNAIAQALDALRRLGAEAAIAEAIRS